MTNWMFKIGDQTRYPDLLGERHVFDNTHSRRVAAGDSFVYLDKRGRDYSLIGHGHIAAVPTRPPEPHEIRNPQVKTMYEAELDDYVRYAKRIDIRASSAEGRRNRERLHIPNVNKLGWSMSIARLEGRLFENILDLAYIDGRALLAGQPTEGFSVPDAWSYVKRRHRLEQFRTTVLERQHHICAGCGTAVRELLDAAHVSDYSTDPTNRANPANGVALCVYCHRAFDRRLLTIHETGRIEVATRTMQDPVAKAHFGNLTAGQRRRLLDGVDAGLLRRRNR